MPLKLHVRISVDGEDPREFDLEFSKSPIVIGRDRESDVQISLSTVSRAHARLIEEEGNWLLEDLHSTHGTLLNGQPIGAGSKKLLHDGDKIGLMHAEIAVSIDLAPDFEIHNDEETAVVARQLLRTDNPLASKQQPYLLVMNGKESGRRVELASNKSELILGRAEGLDIQLDDQNVSRRHARISKDWDQFLIEDLGSKNGVFVSGLKVEQPARLKDGDEIMLGALKLSFVDPASSVLKKLAEVPIFAQEHAQAEEDEGETKVQTQTVSPNDFGALSDEGQRNAQPRLSSHQSKKLFGNVEILLVGLTALVALGLGFGLYMLLKL